jgi:hypothetical protein
MFLFFFGIVQFGLALNQRITIQHAVREGARYAAVHADCEDIQLRTQQRAASAIPNSGDVGVHYPNQPSVAGDDVIVSAPFSYDFPFLSFFHLDIHGTGRVEASARLEMTVPDAEDCGP